MEGGWGPPNPKIGADINSKENVNTDSAAGSKQSLVKIEKRGAWEAQSVKRSTSAQVMISPVPEFEPCTEISAVSAEAPLGPLSSSLSAPPPPLSLSQK